MMTPSNHSLLVLLLMPSQQKCQDAGKEEEDGIHDCKSPARLQHRTVFVDIGAEL
jgi:hypothetical protein